MGDLRHRAVSAADNLSEDQFDRLLNARPRPKVASLVELIAQAKKRQDIRQGVGKQASNGNKGETR